MALQTETPYEYNFAADAYLHYCADHEVLRVADRSGDSVLLTNLSKKQIETFIKYYNEYVKEEETADVED